MPTNHEKVTNVITEAIRQQDAMEQRVPLVMADTFTNTFYKFPGCYFPSTQWTPIGEMKYVGCTLKGWKIHYRAGVPRRGKPFHSLHTQRYVFDGPSLFGALRRIVRRTRQWCGTVYLLKIYEIEPVFEARYEFPKDEDGGDQ